MTALITEKLMRQLVPSIGTQAAAAWAWALNDACRHAGITNRREVNHWLAQLAHESGGFTRFEENLNYTSAARLTKVWPRRFPTVASAQPYVRNPRALANKVYNGRMGNREGSDDGWHFRGRGPKQVTGRENYTALNRWLQEQGLPYNVQTSPELLTSPSVGALSAAWFWAANNISKIVRDNPNETAAVRAVTLRINGGEIGLADRQRWFTRVRGLEA